MATRARFVYARRRAAEEEEQQEDASSSSSSDDEQVEEEEAVVEAPAVKKPASAAAATGRVGRKGPITITLKKNLQGTARRRPPGASPHRFAINLAVRLSAADCLQPPRRTAAIASGVSACG